SDQKLQGESVSRITTEPTPTSPDDVQMGELVDESDTRIKSGGSGVSAGVLATISAVTAVADILLRSRGPIVSFSFPGPKSAKVTQSLELQKSELVKGLLAAGIDPLLFDSLLSNEMDRRLKTRFGIAFLLLTFVFTSTSYTLV